MIHDFCRLSCMRTFHMCPIYRPLLFMFVCCVVSVIGDLAVDSARY